MGINTVHISSEGMITSWAVHHLHIAAYISLYYRKSQQFEEQVLQIKSLSLCQIGTIRNFLVLALPLAISGAASSRHAATDADFGADAVDLNANVIASTNQFEGNRREMLNIAFRDLSVTDQCVAESEATPLCRILYNLICLSKPSLVAIVQRVELHTHAT
jgi:hypothetical protein